MIQPTGVTGFDSVVRQAEAAHQAALAVPGLGTGCCNVCRPHSVANNHRGRRELWGFNS
jgi:hypothetical protein